MPDSDDDFDGIDAHTANGPLISSVPKFSARPDGTWKLKFTELREALRAETNRTNAVLDVIYLAAPFLSDQERSDQVKVVMIQVLFSHMLHMLSLNPRERSILADEIVNLTNKIESSAVLEVLLDPKLMNSDFNNKTGMERTRAALEILKNNPHLLQSSKETQSILCAASAACIDLNITDGESFANINKIVALTADPNTRDWMIQHLLEGKGTKDAAIALGALKYANLDDAMPA
ncbi:MAG: hypothetical protein V1909_00760, partial [Candidatus Micrarchaeota archaeon]